MISSFSVYVDWRFVKGLTTRIFDFFEKAPGEDIEAEIPEIRHTLKKYANPLIQQFPLKTDMNTVAQNRNDLSIGEQDIYSYGLEYGWLEEHLDLKNLPLYNYMSYHFRLGLLADKGHC